MELPPRKGLYYIQAVQSHSCDFHVVWTMSYTDQKETPEKKVALDSSGIALGLWMLYLSQR
jgi:hypothetical protein